jgi:uncharacterized protein (TIGR02453 family)
VTFDGFTDDALEFYERLAADNSRSFWQANRDLYLAAVREPMTALLAELEPEFGPGHVFRPHRDVRFSRDKSPVKDHQGGFVSRPDGTGWYVQLSASGLMVAGGGYDPQPDQLRRYREAVDDDRLGAELDALVDDLDAAGYDFGSDPLKTRPRGYPADHPRIELLRVRRPVAWRELGAPDWLATPAAVDEVRRGWRLTTPLVDWLSRNVGPAAARD